MALSGLDFEMVTMYVFRP